MHRLVRTTILATTTGALAVATAWAGVGLVPVPTSTSQVELPSDAAGAAADAGVPGATALTAATTTAVPPLGQGQALVGAAKVSIAPRPDLLRDRFPGARWETNVNRCKTLSPDYIQRLLTETQQEVDHLATAGSPWPENPNCIYQGGFSIGPVNPVSAFDTDLGLWVRAMAIGDGKETLVLTAIDGEGWFWDYAQKCERCGAKQIAEDLEKVPELKARGVTAKSFVLHASHSHAAPDFIGGWGFVPDWYMAQVTDAIKQAATDAVLGMTPAVVEVGEEEARRHNRERRDTYRSAEEQQLSWLRAVKVQQPEPQPSPSDTVSPSPSEKGKDKKAASPSPSPSPSPTQPPPPEVIVTLGAYAAHPTTKGTNGTVAHPDWPGVFEKRLEERFGGIGIHVMTGLGNISADGGTDMGQRLAELVPAVGDGRLVTDTDLRLDRVTWSHPVTNAPLDALGTPGFFDRQFDAAPAHVRTGKEPETAPCVSGAPQSVELAVTAAKLGNDVVLTTGPGELFSNLTNTVKEKNPGRVVFPVAQANDALGYMPQSFELHPVAQQGLGFVAGGIGFVNYEDSYAIDRCVGDMVLEQTLALLGEVK